MASGGARLNSGPASQPGSRSMQRNAADWRKISLPDPTQVDVPDWPEGFGVPSENEWEFWSNLWLTKAQTVVWREQALYDSVAQYTRVIIDSMHGRRSAQHGTLAKQMREELLLSPAALRAAMIAVVGSEEADALDSITGEKANPAGVVEAQQQSPLARLQAVKSA